MKLILKCIGLMLAIFPFSLALSQPYPNKPVQVITPFPPGGAADIVVRLVTQKLTEELKMSFIVENKPGAGGAIGAQYVAQASPNGYTLLITSSSTLSINPHLSNKNTYDSFKSFSPISLIGYSPNVLVINPKLPFNQVSELIENIKNNPGKYTFASNGAGTLSHLTGEMFKQSSGVEILHVPYKGAAPAMVDLSSGQVSILFVAYASVNAMMQAGKVRPLAVTSSKRLKIAPEIPTLAESGLPGFESNQWWGLFGPVGMPPEIINQLNMAMNKILQSPELKKRFAEEGIDILLGKPAALTKYLQDDFDRWGKVIQKGHITNN